MLQKWNRRLFYGVLVFCGIAPLNLLAEGAGIGSGMTHSMMVFIFQIGVILFAARLMGQLFEKIKMPSVLGELTAGILIGPYLLGSVSLPGFSHGLFGDYFAQTLTQSAGLTVPVSYELYGLATLASILLLFFAGMETDLDLFFRFSFPGTVIGVGGVIFSFAFGIIAGHLFLHLPFSDPANLFLGVMSTATSVGISARILSKKKKMNSPEGVTILAAAVIDDIIGIILLAIVIGFSASHGSGEINWGMVGKIGFKAIAVWLGFTFLGVFFADKIAKFLKIFKKRTTIAVLAFGLAMIVAGVFEQAGLAMIIGAYVVGLSLSKTDISYVIQEKLHTMHDFFVPVFFVIMGMLVDPRVFFEKKILYFGLIYSLSAIVSKYLGASLPSFLFKFNRFGANRIGLGMVPRGEVALIIAGIGISSGILSQQIFGASIMMTLLTTLIAPPLLNLAFQSNQQGTRRSVEKKDEEEIVIDFHSEELTEFLFLKINRLFQSEGFFFNQVDVDSRLFSIRKENIGITLQIQGKKMIFLSDIANGTFIKTMVYEALLALNKETESLKDYAKPETLRTEIAESKAAGQLSLNLGKIFVPDLIIPEILADTKEGVIEELLDVLFRHGKIKDLKLAKQDVMEREGVMSTGMQYGIAIPHAKTEAVDDIVISIGIKNQGVNFEALDGGLSTIFVMILSPKKAVGPHLQLLAFISSVLNDKEARETLLEMKNPQEMIQLIMEKQKELSKKKKK